jgi:hypothetical protein
VICVNCLTGLAATASIVGESLRGEFELWLLRKIQR